MRRAAKADANQLEIVQALRAVGCSVQSLATVGHGCPDLLVGRGGRNFLLELKAGDNAPSRRRLTVWQVDWHQTWRGTVAVVQSVDEALEVVTQYASREWRRHES